MSVEVSSPLVRRMTQSSTRLSLRLGGKYIVGLAGSDSCKRNFIEEGFLYEETDRGPPVRGGNKEWKRNIFEGCIETEAQVYVPDRRYAVFIILGRIAEGRHCHCSHGVSQYSVDCVGAIFESDGEGLRGGEAEALEC